MTLKAPCRQCGVNIEYDDWMSGSEAKCPACNQMTYLGPEIAAPLAKDLRSRIVEKELNRAARSKTDSGKIRNRADSFSNFTMWLCILAVISVLGGGLVGVIHADSDNALEYFVIGLGIGTFLLGTALWTYLLAQIIYIRANTTKD
jgi:hypothetical protein